jgi:hypothetical protein
MSFNLQTLTEGIKQRHVGTQNKRLVEKWSRTGLLRGLNENHRENMATLLENQAAQLLREANTLGGDGGGGDIRGFTNIAFPIVRRVFGGLVANELVSIQPMSLPSGLLFYLDYTYGSSQGGGVGDDAVATYAEGQSIYNQPTGKQIQSGSFATGGQYDLVGSGFSRVHDAVEAADLADEAEAVLTPGSEANKKLAQSKVLALLGSTSAANTFDPDNPTHRALVDHDSQVIDLVKAGTHKFMFVAALTSAMDGFDSTMVKDVAVSKLTDGTTELLDANSAGLGIFVPMSQSAGQEIQGGSAHNVRRLNKLGSLAGGVFTANPLSGSHVLMLVRVSEELISGKHQDDTNHGVAVPAVVGAAQAGRLSLGVVSFVKSSAFSADPDVGDALTVPVFESDFGKPGKNPGNPSPTIPEIDIKIESLPVTAQTRKLRARWSPELAQDLNAYHSMDAEVELTQILSEQIALEIDREILNDLLTQARGANFFWSRAPGKFVNKRTGEEIQRASTLNPGPAFTGTVREWYETLTETIIDVANEIHRKTLRGSANFIVVSPDVATVLEASVLYRPSYSLDGDGQVGAPFTMGAEKIGTLSNRFTVYKDPYFPRNKILVGYKGGSYLETGFVYAPYVPLIVTPTIFQPEDFTPRKGVMTRYGKKMVRADFYGTVTCLDMNVI